MVMKKGILSLERPVQRGAVTDWHDMEAIRNYILHDELKVAPEEHPVLMTDAIHNPRWGRANTTQILFEKFKVPAMYVPNEQAMCLYASGRNSGVVLDSGYGLTQIVPVYEGYTLPYVASKVKAVGSDITSYLGQSLRYDETH
ncbi:actin family [Aspergillus candidus]|uniref:Actin family n=1 Tax=Aspergillus candidus TaxID=41067 RepID=A0A2I2F5Z0_ASPCN|nr:actin family [Aspergillus candidus]PLB36043.1 actin family [Aspergillus candidus]